VWLDFEGEGESLDPTWLPRIDPGLPVYLERPRRLGQASWPQRCAGGRPLRENRPLPPMPPDEAAVVNYGMEFYKTHNVSAATFQTALHQFGPQGLAELTTLMGYYALLAFNANAFQIDLPERPAEPLLPV
jgi:hypothetical protein